MSDHYNNVPQSEDRCLRQKNFIERVCGIFFDSRAEIRPIFEKIDFHKLRVALRHILTLATLTCASVQAAPPAGETLASGVVITHLRQGDGPAPSASDTVTVHYRGTLTNGTEFDSSYKRNEPATFALKRVIPCWTEGMQRMHTGGKARLFCPAHMAYGTRGIPGIIPPNSVLIFDVELLAIK